MLDLLDRKTQHYKAILWICRCWSSERFRLLGDEVKIEILSVRECWPESFLALQTDSVS